MDRRLFLYTRGLERIAHKIKPRDQERASDFDQISPTEVRQGLREKYSTRESLRKLFGSRRDIINAIWDKLQSQGLAIEKDQATSFLSTPPRIVLQTSN